MRIRLLVLCVLILPICYSLPGWAKSLDPAATCDRYAELLSSDFWSGESRKRAKVFLSDYIDPLASEVRLLRSLAATRSFTVGLADGALSLLDLSKAYDTLGCATASMILAKVETQTGKPAVSQMLRDFSNEIRKGKNLDKSATQLLTALSAYAKAIEDFEFQQDVPDFPAKEMGERMMQVATATHKAKGTLKGIALSARQYIAALHADYLIQKSLAKSVIVKSSQLRDVPATINTQISSDYLTYVAVEVKAAQQWDTISFAITANGQPISVAKCNVKGGEQTYVAFPTTGKTSVDLKVFNGLNCKNTNWLRNRFSASISFLQRSKRDSKAER